MFEEKNASLETKTFILFLKNLPWFLHVVEVLHPWHSPAYPAGSPGTPGPHPLPTGGSVVSPHPPHTQVHQGHTHSLQGGQ